LGEKHLTTDRARQAARTGYMWRVLALSLTFASLVVLGVWIWNSAANPRQSPGERGQEHVLAQPNLGPSPARTPGDKVVAPTPVTRALSRASREKATWRRRNRRTAAALLLVDVINPIYVDGAEAGAPVVYVNDNYGHWGSEKARLNPRAGRSSVSGRTGSSTTVQISGVLLKKFRLRGSRWNTRRTER
jgi:hypothetical protein